jgi:hypothetical protein
MTRRLRTKAATLAAIIVLLLTVGTALAPVVVAGPGTTPGAQVP